MSNDSQRAFSRVAVVNRGEPAMRLINAVREWNAEGRPPLRVIAVYTVADRRATFVREADEAVLIGPADPGEAFAASPYLDYAELERALRACRADAVCRDRGPARRGHGRATGVRARHRGPADRRGPGT